MKRASCFVQIFCIAGEVFSILLPAGFVCQESGSSYGLVGAYILFFFWQQHM